MNIFTRKTEEPVYSEAITMVHDEFNSAGERLYQEALQIINSTTLLNEDKVQRLIKLGFKSTKEVVDAQDIIEKRKLNEEMVETISYYRTKYPLNKFITEEQVKQICSKYGLIYGDIGNYTGFVPEKNMRAIESFVLDDDDKRAYTQIVPFSMWGGSKTELKRGEYKRRKELENELIEAYKNAPTDEAKQQKKAEYIQFMKYEYIYTDDTMLIAAPKKDFIISDKQEIKDFKLVNKPVPDPVILMPVIGGYLIVTAWGDEASDPLVKNEIEN